MYVFMYKCISTFLCIMYTCMCSYTNMSLSVYLYMYVCIHLQICVYLRFYASCMYVCIHIQMVLNAKEREMAKASGADTVGDAMALEDFYAHGGSKLANVCICVYICVCMCMCMY